MMEIHALITTVHADARSVASSLAPDNLTGMTTTADANRVTTVIHGTQIRSIIASVDDYLMNLAIADETTTLPQLRQEPNETREG
ncbi:MAG: KEOPS complex subunit Pcc1 [Methanoregula sp.]